MKKLSNINESLWSDIQDKNGKIDVRKEDNIDDLEFVDFFVYLKNRYEVCVNKNFFEIGQFLTPGTYTGNISLPIEKNNSKETPNRGNRMLMIQKDLSNEYTKDNFFPDQMWIKPNQYVFMMYPNELEKIFGDKYIIDSVNYEIKLKEGKITNQVCVDVIDKLLGMVKNPILKIKE